MESSYLKTLVEIAKSGGISKAADVLCITQPAVSKRIRFLEEHFGYPLLERVGNTLRPTEAGSLVVDKALRLLEIESELLADLESFSGKARISFSCTSSFGICHLPQIVKDFMLNYNNLMVDLNSFETPESIVKDLHTGVVDLAVIEHCQYYDLEGLTRQSLPESLLIFFSSPKFCLPSPATELEQLLDKPLFTQKEGCCSRIMLEKNLKQVGHDLREFRQVIVFDDLRFIIKAVLDGDGISFLPRDLVSDYLDRNHLVEHQIPGFNLPLKRSLVFSAKRARSACHDYFAGAVCSHFNLPLFRSEALTAAP